MLSSWLLYALILGGLWNTSYLRHLMDLKSFLLILIRELHYFLAIRMVLVIRRTVVLALAGNARRSLEWILPTSYRGRQEENAENQRNFEEEGNFVSGFDSNAIQLHRPLRAG